LGIKTLNEGIPMMPIILLQPAAGVPRKQAQGDTDDDPLVRGGIGDLVTSLGYRCLTFASSEEFLESCQVSNTVCLITDLHMPGLNGLDLQQHLQQTGYCTPVIFVTAFPDGRERALKAGAVAYLSKPFEESSLISAVGSALRAS
jgi:FixJ family two-component response regulator